jgi:O-acetyl-ADP-ribose deacetylase
VPRHRLRQGSFRNAGAAQGGRVRAYAQPVERGPKVVVVQTDITAEKVDAIVNAANESLAAGGGVDGAIHEAAGEAELSAALRLIGRCEMGDAKVTPGFRLPARYIIHTVGPIWRGGDQGEADLLASCYRRCLQRADEIGAASISFPAISTGAFGFPDAEAAEIAVRTIRSTPTEVGLVRLVAFDRRTFDLYEAALGRT